LTGSTLVLELPGGGGTIRTETGAFSYCREALSLVVAVSLFEPIELLLSPTSVTSDLIVG
jgi:hypothetical protein